MPSNDPIFQEADTPATIASAENSAPVPVSPKGNQPTYVKLPGRMATLRIGAYGIRSLYLGDDHLLHVDTVFFVEHYKRFAYADIQALVLRQTVRGLVMSIILGVIVAGFGLIGLAVNEPAGRWILWGVAGFFGIFLIVNLARGATCQCQLETAIGPQKLLSLSRMRPARKAFRLLTERIKAAQGELTAEDAAARVDERRGESAKTLPG